MIRLLWCALFILVPLSTSAQFIVNHEPKVEIHVWYNDVELDPPGPCSYFVSTMMEVELRTHWIHENPKGYYWKWRDFAILNNVTLVPLVVGGFPVAFEWWVRPYGVLPYPNDWHLVETCGDEAPPVVWPWIFSDGFETGTDGWSNTVGLVMRLKGGG